MLSMCACLCEYEFRHPKLCFSFQLRAATFSAMSAAWLEEHVSNEGNAKYSQREFRRQTRKRQLQNIVRNELIKCACFDLCIPHSTKDPLAVYQGGWKDQFLSRTSAEVHKDLGVLFHLWFFNLLLMTAFHFELWTQEQRCSELQMLGDWNRARQQGLGCQGMETGATEHKHGRGAGSWAVNTGCASRSCVNMVCLAGHAWAQGLGRKTGVKSLLLGEVLGEISSQCSSSSGVAIRRMEGVSSQEKHMSVAGPWATHTERVGEGWCPCVWKQSRSGHEKTAELWNGEIWESSPPA